MRRVTSPSPVWRLLIRTSLRGTLGLLPLAAGCAGRSDVTAGPDQAKNLPARPHSAPQQYPTASQLPAAREPTPATQQRWRHGPGAATTRASTQPLPSVPAPDPAAARVPSGFKVEVVMHGLTYPTSVEFDDAGNLYVAEAGDSYGDPAATPRILRVSREGKIQTAAEGEPLEGPVNDLLWHDGRLYVAHRGKISVLERAGGRVRDLVTGLPSEGDHHTNQMTVGPDGKVYFGQGTATNSGVVGTDNHEMGWLGKHPDFHDVPARDLKLTGRTFETPNPLSRTEEQVQTSAYHPFAKAAPEGAVIRGRTKAAGTVLRMNADGSELEVYAWGLRNPFGVMWSPDGTLYATENGFDVRGSRPIANDPEDVYVIRQGGWYGWPDFAAGMPVTDPRFKPDGEPQPQFLMADHPPVEKPWLNFPKHAAIAKLDFAPSGPFGKGRLFIAFFGHMTPMTGTPPKAHGGHRVVAVDPASKEVEEFFTKREPGHGGHHGQAASAPAGEAHEAAQDESVSPGPRRLVDVRFGPEGDALFVADFGSLVLEQGKPRPIPGTGVIWRITKLDAQASAPPAGLAAPK